MRPDPVALAVGLDDLRRGARDAYAQGRLTEAVETQAAVLTMAAATAVQSLDDFLFAGLLYHAAGRIQDGLRVLQDGIGLYPADPALRENLAVLLIAGNDMTGAVAAAQAALSLGSNSPNIHDCLCEAQYRSGRYDLAVLAGRLALVNKDQRFSETNPVVTVPQGPPPPFNPGQPDHNVIAYSLWGNDPQFQVPLLENAKIRPHLFPSWTIRVYHDDSVDASYLTELARHGVHLVSMGAVRGAPVYRGLLWRFGVIADPTVQRFLIRDADSLLTVKERVAVDAWLGSAFHFHAMRDWYTHTDLILAGMWGGVGGILPAPDVLMRARTFWRMETDHVDQDLLSETVWPVVRNHILIHDSIFQGALGSVPFPPFGDLPPGHHVGQNAFLHFSKSA